ncbi:MAG: SCO1664 family protein [Acidimicrobiia bacterium]|jgi:uncharacterized repeat protein (TIGR03843 family)
MATDPAAESLETHLREGEVEVLGRMPWSSNGTFLCEVDHGGSVMRAIYKPRRAERPLWDFPSGLDHREVAAFELSRALGWDLVPVTVRRDGPLGPGSVQAFVEADFEQHYFTLVEDEAHHDSLRALCTLDLVGNNTDRKSGHVLLARDGRIQGIDHGLMFHHEFKLRTVIWDFGGQPIPDWIRSAVSTLVDAPLPAALADLLDPLERDALVTRARALVSAPCFPVDETGRRYPWPLV